MNEETVQTEVLEDETTEETIEEVSEEKTEEQNEKPNEEPKQSKSQSTKQRLRRKLRESEEQTAQLLQKNQELDERFTTLESKLDGVINPPASRPARDNFETEEEYEDALHGYWKPQEVEEKKSEPKPVQKDALSKETRQNWDEQVDIASEKYEDFDAVINDNSLRMTDAMAQTIAESNQGGEVAYFLAKNPTEAERISYLPLTAQIKEIDKLTKKFTSTTSSAPTPITPTKGTDTAIKDVEKMSMQEYANYRNGKGA